MNRLLMCGATALMGAGPAAAQEFTAQNGVQVVPVSGGFSVQGVWVSVRAACGALLLTMPEA